MQLLIKALFIVAFLSISTVTLGEEKKGSSADKSTEPQQLSESAASESLEAESYGNLPFKRSDVVGTPKLVTSYIILMVLLVGGIIVLWIIRRKLQQKGSLPLKNSEKIRYQERCRLSAHTQVYVVTINNSEYLIADNGQALAIQMLPAEQNQKAAGSL